MELLKNNGVIIYIDDKYDEEEIPKSFVLSLEAQKYINALFKEIPNIDYVKDNKAIIKMVIMDWTLWDETDEVPSEAEEEEKLKKKLANNKKEEKNAFFIKDVLNLNIPVVIFTQLNEDVIINKLMELHVISEDINEHPLLLVYKKKKDISSIIEEWYNKMPSAKIYDKIRTHLLTAESNFFKDLIISKNAWIKSLFGLYCKDHGVKLEDSIEDKTQEFVAASNDFTAFMINCIKNRVQANGDFAASDIIEMIKAIEDNKADVMLALENIRFLSDEKLLPRSVMPGDVFAEGKTYYLNVRAECDTARYEDKVNLYLLKGVEIKEENFYNKQVCSVCLEEHEKPLAFLGQYNQILYNDSNFTIPYICEGKIIQFKFKDIYIGNYDPINREIAVHESVVKEDDGKLVAQVKIYKRKGRVLPPYSLKIQQRFSEYFGRIGLDSIPDIMIDKPENNI